MSKVAPYHTSNYEEPPSHRNVYHDEVSRLTEAINRALRELEHWS